MLPKLKVMNKTTQYILAAGAGAVVGYRVWKNRKPKQAKVVSQPKSGKCPEGEEEVAVNCIRCVRQLRLCL